MKEEKKKNNKNAKKKILNTFCGFCKILFVKKYAVYVYKSRNQLIHYLKCIIITGQLDY